jgi:integrase/recombinase XerC
VYKFIIVKLKDLLSSFIGHLNVEKKYSQHTCISYENDISGFLNYCENDFEIYEVANIQSTHIRSWIVSLMSDRHISNVSVNRKISALRSFYKWMLRKSHVSINPMLKILAPKKAKTLACYCSRCEFRKAIGTKFDL